MSRYARAHPEEEPNHDWFAGQRRAKPQEYVLYTDFSDPSTFTQDADGKVSQMGKWITVDELNEIIAKELQKRSVQ